MKKHKSFLARLFGWLLGIVLTVVILVAGVCIFVNKKYDINLFQTYSEVKLLSKAVDEEKLCTNRFTAEDMSSAQTEANSKMTNLITGNAEDGYEIGQHFTADSMLSAELRLSDKQMAAIIHEIINDQEGGFSVALGGENATVEILQLKFENIDNNTGSADVNIVLKIDISFMKEKMNAFPLSLFKKYVPKTLYISSTNTVTKNEGSFSYTVTSKSMSMNSLTADQTADLVKTLNVLAQVGSVSELNETIGKTFINLLIGDENNTNGLTYSLKDFGVKDYTFYTQDNIGYFVMKNV